MFDLFEKFLIAFLLPLLMLSLLAFIVYIPLKNNSQFNGCVDSGGAPKEVGLNIYCDKSGVEL